MIGGADDRTCLHDNTSHVLYLVFGTDEIKIDFIEDIIHNVIKEIKILDSKAIIDYNIYKLKVLF